MKELSRIRFILDGQEQCLEFTPGGQLQPTLTVLNYLRGLSGHKGVKEGCAEGDCGACTVVIAEPVPGGGLRYLAVDSCILFLPALHGKQLITVENLARQKDGRTVLHPVQQALVDLHGSQCGYCTPGIVMSLFALYKTHHHPDPEVLSDALVGNLCRCTGYRPILDAAKKVCAGDGKDHFTKDAGETEDRLRRIIAEQPSVAIETGERAYYRPATLREALRIRKRRPEAIVINGATDVALRQTKKHEVLPVLLDLSAIEELKSYTEKRSAWLFGSGMSMEQLRRFVRGDIPALEGMLDVFASLQIRHVATLGGNIASASPIGDLLPVLFALGASVELTGSGGKRRLFLQDFILGYRKTALAADELITAVIIPKPVKNMIYWSHKVSKRKDLDISTVSAGFSLLLNRRSEVAQIILAYGGMAECTKRATAAEQFLLGKKWDRLTVREAMREMETCFTPISDARAGKDFRMTVAKNLLMKFYLDTLTNSRI